MAMVCAQCNQIYDQSERICPMCGIQLFVHRRSTARPDDAIVAGAASAAPWHQSALGRVVICLLLAQGLAFCLQQLFTAWILGGGYLFETWYTPVGLIALHVFHLLGLVVGGMLVAANQERGIATGSILGLWNGCIFLAVHRVAHDVMPPWLFFAQPLLHLLFGAFGGWLGNRIWPPVTVVTAQDEPTAGERAKGPVAPPRPWLRGPIHTARVALGATFAVLGVVFSRHLMEEILLNFPNFHVTTHFQDALMRYQVAAVAAFLGAAFAGATTANGFKQGLCVGIMASSLFIGIQFANPKATLEPTLFTAFAVFGVSLAGGSFGSALFPPVAPRTKKAIPY